MLRRSLLGLLVLWTAAALLAEVRGALTSWDARADWRTSAESWRFRTPQVAHLEQCLASARRLVPAGNIVAFAGPDEPKGSALFLTRWAAYLLPAHDVLAREDPAAVMARYVITYGVPLQGPRQDQGIELVRRLPGCELYRVRRP
ncbi:MAG: hypothetical protein QOF89_2200 [Acidobacteriota bacterium]|jgi:hypothetical protein|nr:hypothetical protein [Acidobacteriota bacterium]